MTRQEILAAAKPILFNTEMVRAILEGRKTVTRRHPFQSPEKYCEYKGLFSDDRNKICAIFGCSEDETTESSRARYKVGDLLYVRETFCEYIADHVIDGVRFAYKANSTPNSEEARIELGYKWSPSIHMPKEAARIFLRVTGVRCERLQDCGNVQAKDEGFTCCTQFARLWDSTIKPADLPLYGWEANPWVWVYQFERNETK